MEKVLHIKTYTVTKVCQNCYKQVDYKVPFGEIAAEYSDACCPNCGISEKRLQEYLTGQYKSQQIAAAKPGSAT